jgi:hypothetical protein
MLLQGIIGGTVGGVNPWGKGFLLRMPWIVSDAGLFRKVLGGTGILPVRVHRLKTCATKV